MDRQIFIKTIWRNATIVTDAMCAVNC